jgi:NADPH2:quinone reductase
MYPAKPPLPHILGRAGVGEGLETGAGVETVRTGQMVGILRCDAGVETRGTLAEKTVIPAASLAPIPAGWSVQEMSGAPLTFLTAWQALTQWQEAPALPPEGTILLITGASGGVGVAGVLLGKSLGMTVIALSRSAEKGNKLKELGADFVFDPNDGNLRKSVLAAIAPRKVDLVLDNIGGALFNQVLATIGYRANISVVGRSAGPVPEFNTASLFFRRNRIGGVAVGDYTPQSAQADWKEIVRRLAVAGKKPVVDRIFPFEEVPAAFRRLAQGPMGKVLVQVAG